MSTESNRTLEKVQRRSEALAKTRRFFDEKGLLEVDPLLLSEASSIDAHIDLFATHPTANWKKRFLFSSPEYPMKRLLADGVSDIYYLGHVFREEPQGRVHFPEFLMAEWYRLDFSFLEMIEETASFLRLFLGPISLHLLPYKDAFLNACGFHPFSISLTDLLKKAKQVSSFSTLPLDSYTKDDLLNLFLTEYVEPSFDPNCITALLHFPKSQAALAEQLQDAEGFDIAERFELFYQGLELANGYHELKDHEEQRNRLAAEQKLRLSLGKEALIIDSHFLEALQKGLPNCCGVAVGVDRLIMLEQKAPSLASIYPIPWDKA